MLPTIKSASKSNFLDFESKHNRQIKRKEFLEKVNSVKDLSSHRLRDGYIATDRALDQTQIVIRSELKVRQDEFRKGQPSYNVYERYNQKPHFELEPKVQSQRKTTDRTNPYNNNLLKSKKRLGQRNNSEVQIKIKSSKAFDHREVNELAEVIQKMNKLKFKEQEALIKQQKIMDVGENDSSPTRNLGQIRFLKQQREDEKRYQEDLENGLIHAAQSQFLNTIADVSHHQNSLPSLHKDSDLTQSSASGFQASQSKAYLDHRNISEIKNFLSYKNEYGHQLSTLDTTSAVPLKAPRKNKKAQQQPEQQNTQTKTTVVHSLFDELESKKKENLQRILVTNDTHYLDKQSKFKLRFAGQQINKIKAPEQQSKNSFNRSKRNSTGDIPLKQQHKFHIDAYKDEVKIKQQKKSDINMLKLPFEDQSDLSFDDFALVDKYPLCHTTLRNNEDQSAFEFANNFFGVEKPTEGEKLQDGHQAPTTKPTFMRSNSSFSIGGASGVGGLAFRKAGMEQKMKRNQAYTFNLLRQTLPYFSGSVTDTEVNYLLELDILKRILQDGSLSIQVSPRHNDNIDELDLQIPYSKDLYPYLQGLLAQTKMQFFSEDSLNKSKKSLSVLETSLQTIFLPNPYIERLQSHEPVKPMQGVIIYKRPHQSGFQPPGRAFGGIACLNDYKLVLYGGQAGKLYNDVRALDTDNYDWKLVSRDEDTKDLYSRYAHCVGAFDQYLVTFGGYGDYNKKTKHRQTFNDVAIFDVFGDKKYVKYEGNLASYESQIKNQGIFWKNIGTKTLNQQIHSSSVYYEAKPTLKVHQKTRQLSAIYAPEPRAWHAGCVIGAGLFIHGGQGISTVNLNKSVILPDFHLFDLGLFSWIKLNIVAEEQGGKAFNLQRKMHTMTAIQNHVTATSIREDFINTRIMWCDKLQNLTDNKLRGSKRKKARKNSSSDQTVMVDRAGFFIFGGLDQNERVVDDLYLVQFDIEANKNIILQGEFKADQIGQCHMIAQKVQSQGKGPIARYKHASAVFNNYFVVYGGRNDSQYSDQMKTVALNDINMLCLFSNTWVTVAIFGDSMITSRWGHSLVASKEKLLILGGMNLNHICDSAIYEINFDQSQLEGYIQTKTISVKLPPPPPEIDPKTNQSKPGKRDEQFEKELGPASSLIWHAFGRMVKKDAQNEGQGRSQKTNSQYGLTPVASGYSSPPKVKQRRNSGSKIMNKDIKNHLKLKKTNTDDKKVHDFDVFGELAGRLLEVSEEGMSNKDWD